MGSGLNLKNIIVAAALIVVLAGGYAAVKFFIYSTPAGTDNSVVSAGQETNIGGDTQTAAQNPGVGMDKPTEPEEAEEDGGGELNEVSPGLYAVYDQEALDAARARGDKLVLFFYAQWCPFCREADAEFLSSLDKIPPGVTILKTDYDQEKALKQKYGVTYQHTFVQIDAADNLVTKWNGGAVPELTANLK